MSEVFRQQLLDDGAIGLNASLTPLTGGVSSDIYKVDDGDRVFVVKRALEKLKVADDWHADLSRNGFEVAYLNVVSQFLQEAVPKVLFHNPENGYFAMEHLGDGFENWKTTMLGGDCRIEHARRAGEVLGRIHRETWNDSELRAGFETTDNFHDLRLEPYLLKTAERHPDLSQQLLDEADRIRNTRRCLVHGDFSPKNMLFNGDRLVVLDCEVAWFGDPAFDVAFLLNHLMIKALHVDPVCFELAREAWQAYAGSLTNYHPELAEGPPELTLIDASSEAIEASGSLEASQQFCAKGQREVPRQARDDSCCRVVEGALTKLLPALMLARVDGKSPVEYLNDSERVRLREFARNALINPVCCLEELIERAQGTL